MIRKRNKSITKNGGNFMKISRKKMTERIIVCMLIVCLVYNMIPAFALNAYAEPATNKAALTMNGTTTEYATFADALEHASGTATITLLGDDTNTCDNIVIGSGQSLHSLTITSNGPATLDCKGEIFQIVNGGELTIDGAGLTMISNNDIIDLEGGAFDMKAGVLRSLDPVPILNITNGIIHMSGGMMESLGDVITTTTTDASGTIYLSGGKLIADSEVSLAIGLYYGTYNIILSGGKNMVFQDRMGNPARLLINSGVNLFGKDGDSSFTGAVELCNLGIDPQRTLKRGETAVVDASPDAQYFYMSPEANYSEYGLEQSGNNLIVSKGNQSAPTELTGGNLTIDGTTTDMEYAATSTATTWTTCSSDSTVVSNGEWYVRYKETDAKKASQAVPVTAWKECTIHYDTNDIGTAPSDQLVHTGITIAEPTAPQQGGYRFGGWYKEASCVNKWNFSTDVVTDSMTLWAKWETLLSKPTVSGNTYYTGTQQSAALSGFDSGKMNVSGDKNTDAGTYDVTVSIKDKNTYCWSDGSTADLHLSWVIQSFATDKKATADLADGGSTTNNSPIVLTAPTGYMIAPSLSGTWANTMASSTLQEGKNTLTYYLKHISDGYVDVTAKTYIVNVSASARPEGSVNSNVDTTTAPTKVAVTGENEIFNQLVSDPDKGYTASDKAIVDAGGSADIKVKVDKLEYKTFQDKVDAIDKTAGDSGLTVGLFLDLSVTKIMKSVSGDETTTQLKELPTLLTFQIDLPEKLIGMKEYVIYRHHDNKVDVITSTPNKDGEMVTLSKDGKQLILKLKKFSVYAIGYKSSSNSNSSETNNSGSTSNTTVSTTTNTTIDTPVTSPKDASANPAKTGDETNIMLWFILLIVSCGVLGTATVIHRKKKQKS
jgi:hypothetical protein